MDAIILSAGSGKRFGGDIPKTFALLNNKPLLYYSLYSFEMCSFVRRIFIVISENFTRLSEDYHKKYFYRFKKFSGFIRGGNERRHSVQNSLKYIKINGGVDFVALHDGARPFIKMNLINDLFEAAKQFGSSAPGINLVDTVKIIDQDNFIVSHPDREKMVAIQTPQIFEFKLICEAYNLINDDKNFTDDTEIYSILKKNVKVVPGDNDLMKITYKEDLLRAKEIFRRIKHLWK